MRCPKKKKKKNEHLINHHSWKGFFFLLQNMFEKIQVIMNYCTDYGIIITEQKN